MYDFYCTFFEEKDTFYQKGNYVICVAGALEFLVNRLDNTVVNLIFAPVLFLTIGIIFFIGDIYKRIFVGIMSLVILIGSELIGIGVMKITAEEMLNQSMVNRESAMIITLIVKMISLIIFAIAKKICIITDKDMDAKTTLLYLIIPFTSTGIMISIVYSGIDFSSGNKGVYVLIFNFVMMIVGNIIIFYQFTKYADMLREKEEIKRNIVISELKLEGYKQQKQANERYLSMLHDVSHYINSITNLTKKDEAGMAQEIAKSITDEYEKVANIEYSQNLILNTILTEYKELAEENEVKFDCFVERGFNVEYVEEIDLVTMLGNMMSNAFEAASKSTEKYIKIQMFMQNDGCFSIINIVNSYTGEIKAKGENILTIKKEKEMHGWGLKNINKAAEKYKGYLSTDWGNSEFRSSLILENILKNSESEKTAHSIYKN
jgi:hypothetical protein